MRTRTVPAVALALVCLLLGACASPQEARPILERSVVESIPAASPASEIEFFDALAERPLVCHDDALQSVLLLKGSASANDYPARVKQAQELGLLDSGFDRPAREAATIGDVSKLLVRATDEPATIGRLSQDRAVSRLVTRGWLPTQARSFQGLTGAQMVTLITAAGDQLASQPRTEPAQTAPAAASSEEPIARPRPEPLPVVAVEPERPVVAKPIEPSVAAPTPPAPSTTWLPGKPIKRPRS